MSGPDFIMTESMIGDALFEYAKTLPGRRGRQAIAINVVLSPGGNCAEVKFCETAEEMKAWLKERKA